MISSETANYLLPGEVHPDLRSLISKLLSPEQQRLTANEISQFDALIQSIANQKHDTTEKRRFWNNILKHALAATLKGFNEINSASLTKEAKEKLQRLGNMLSLHFGNTTLMPALPDFDLDAPTAPALEDQEEVDRALKLIEKLERIEEGTLPAWEILPEDYELIANRLKVADHAFTEREIWNDFALLLLLASTFQSSDVIPEMYLEMFYILAKSSQLYSLIGLANLSKLAESTSAAGAWHTQLNHFFASKGILLSEFKIVDGKVFSAPFEKALAALLGYLQLSISNAVNPFDTDDRLSTEVQLFLGRHDFSEAEIAVSLVQIENLLPPGSYERTKQILGMFQASLEQ